MIQNIIKKVLRKWLKKKLYKGGYGIPLNEKRFPWVYNSPIRQWKDRIWVLRHTAIGTTESFFKLFAGRVSLQITNHPLL